VRARFGRSSDTGYCPVRCEARDPTALRPEERELQSDGNVRSISVKSWSYARLSLAK
jgi:hypothetical protein